MYLKSLKATNYRNYQEIEFEFKSPLTVLVGDNAQGKSNFLESIYFLSTTKSTKAQKDEELITQDQQVMRVNAQVESRKLELNELEIVMAIQEGNLSKRVKVNGVPKRVIDYIGQMAVVLFAPEDINLVSGTPSLRRWHIDLTLAQIDREYKSTLTNYGDVLTRRNKVLKLIQAGLSQLDQLDFWNEKLLEYGQIISQKRVEFFEFLNKTDRKFGNFQLYYKQSLLSAERLKEYQAKEVAACASLIGPHRDDFLFLLSSLDLAKFGSRGETRTAVLDLKMAELQFIESKLGERPILLLDDVFSELDFSHREHVLDLVSEQQTIIAAVELDDHLSVYFEQNGQIYQVKAGTISEKSKD